MPQLKWSILRQLDVEKGKYVFKVPVQGDACGSRRSFLYMAAFVPEVFGGGMQW
jgi:hypothetical protein